MDPITILIFALIVAIFYIQIRKYRQSNPFPIPQIPKEVPKEIKKEMLKDVEKAQKKFELVKQNMETFTGNGMIEEFTDIKDIRYGRIGCSNCPNGESINNWIKLARLDIKGPWTAKGFTLEIYPRIRWTVSGRQTIVSLVRNTDRDLEIPYVSIHTHTEPHPNTRAIKDMRVVRVAGSGTNNIVEVWAQLGTGWADNIYSMFYLYGIDASDTIITEKSEMAKSVPAGQNWGVTDKQEPNGIFNKDLTMEFDPSDKNIHGFYMTRTDEANRFHGWKQWHMNDAYGRNDYQLWEYAADSKGNACGGNAADGARCQPRMTVKGASGNVGINTTNPRNTLEVAGDLRVTGRIIIGNTVLKPEGNYLAIEKEDGRRIMLLTPDWDKIQIYRDSNGRRPYFYFNKNGAYGIW